MAQESLCGFLSLVNKDIHYCCVSFVGVMAMKIGSVRSAKTRRAQDRMVQTGQKRDQSGCKGDLVGPIQTHGEGHCFVYMLLLACNDVALACFQF